MRYFITLVLVALFIGGCATAKAPVTGRNQIILVSQSETLSLGEKSYKTFLLEAKLSKNISDVNMVKRIGQKIAKVSNRPDYKWEFNLVENEQVNAFCLPGGKVIVYTGILKIAQNEDQLATVMSHEIAHALARHGAERMSYSMISDGVYSLGSVLIKSQVPQYSGAFKQAYGIGTNIGVMLPYSREHEYEADEIGIHLMYKAGYDILEAVKFWQNMQRNSKISSPEFLSTHPHSENRIKKISEIVKKIQN